MFNISHKMAYYREESLKPGVPPADQARLMYVRRRVFPALPPPLLATHVHHTRPERARD